MRPGSTLNTIDLFEDILNTLFIRDFRDAFHFGLLKNTCMEKTTFLKYILNECLIMIKHVRVLALVENIPIFLQKNVIQVERKMSTV